MIVHLIYAVKALNNMGYYHADIKPENIFVDIATEHLVLGDLGGCIPIMHNIFECVGTHVTAAPEHLKQSKFYDNSQIWSIGATILLSHMISSKKNDEIIKLLNSGNVKNVILQLDDIEFEKSVVDPKLSKSFIKYCMNIDYKTRPSMVQLVNHKYILPYIYTEIPPTISSNRCSDFI